MNADDLSVKLVCNEAGISKQTLYNKYYGVLGAIEELVFDLMEDAAKDYAGSEMWAEQIRAVLQMLIDNKDVFMHLYFSKYKDDLLGMINARVQPMVGLCMDKYAEEAGVVLDDFDKKILVAYFMDVYIGGFNRFMRNRLSDDPDYIISRYKVLVRGHAIDAIRKFAELKAENGSEPAGSDM